MHSRIRRKLTHRRWTSKKSVHILFSVCRSNEMEKKGKRIVCDVRAACVRTKNLNINILTKNNRKTNIKWICFCYVKRTDNKCYFIWLYFPVARGRCCCCRFKCNIYIGRLWFGQFLLEIRLWPELIEREKNGVTARSAALCQNRWLHLSICTYD